LQSKVIRVLNLWQKNSVFPPAVIQPLLDLATDPTNSELFDKGLTSQKPSQTMIKTYFSITFYSASGCSDCHRLSTFSCCAISEK
jgi:hypothetical protein